MAKKKRLNGHSYALLMSAKNKKRCQEVIILLSVVRKKTILNLIKPTKNDTKIALTIAA